MGERREEDRGVGDVSQRRRFEVSRGFGGRGEEGREAEEDRDGKQARAADERACVMIFLFFVADMSVTWEAGIGLLDLAGRLDSS